jgi:hypothetical protein
LEKTVSFLGIHKWEPDIYNEFSLALHLQCSAPAFYGSSMGLKSHISQKYKVGDIGKHSIELGKKIYKKIFCTEIHYQMQPFN